MDVSSLDSPGASSGYCSGTEKELGFSWDCMDLETGSPDRRPGSSLDLDADVCSSYDGVTCCEPEVTQIRDLWDEISDDLDHDDADSLEAAFGLLPDDLRGYGPVTDPTGTEVTPEEMTDNWDAMFSEEDWRNLGGAGVSLHSYGLSPLEYCQELGDPRDVDALMEEPDKSSIVITPDFVDLFCSSLHPAPFDSSSDAVLLLPLGHNGVCQEAILGFDAPILESSGGHEDSRTISGRSAVKNGEQITSKNIKLARRECTFRIEDRIDATFAVLEPKRDDIRTSRSPKLPVTSPEVTPRRCSVLEALLKTSGRLSPNQGSNAILCREIKRKGDDETGNRNRIQQQRQQQRPNRTRPTQKHRNFILHNLLACRTDGTERGRRGNPQSGGHGGKGRVEADRSAGDALQIDPTADCDNSILFDSGKSGLFL